MADLPAGREGGGSRAKKIVASDGGGQTYYRGAIIRGDTSQKRIALVFTADEFGDGGNIIADMLAEQQARASFFFTGNFYRNKHFRAIIKKLKKGGHYLGAHSDRHLLYCSWEKRDSLLVSKEKFTSDLLNNYEQLRRFGVKQEDAPYFLPPYEWYNDSISQWTRELGLQLINFSPGTLSTADYTWPGLTNYRNSEEIYGSIINYEKTAANGLNGFILLVHLGTDPRRKDRFYYRLPQLIDFLKSKGYAFQRVDELLSIRKN